MGHPIDPGDPRNGGVPTCLAWMPDQLEAMVWRTHPPGFCSGPITQAPGHPGEYGGALTGFINPQPFWCLFGFLAAHTFWCKLSVVQFKNVSPWDCDVPVTFEDFGTPPNFFGVVDLL